MNNVQIVYRAGKDNKSADALSRAPQSYTLSPDDSEEIVQVSAVSVKE